MRVVIAFFVLVIVFSLSACANSSSTFPEGEYRDLSGRTVTFMADGTYTLYTSAGNLAVSEGSYSIEGDTLNILYDNDFCFGIEGKYSWSVERDKSITLDLLEGGCVGRAPSFGGSLTPVP